MSAPSHSASTPVDAARLSLLLNELRLPAIKTLWPQFAETADTDGWPAARFLAAIAEHELAERDRRRIERHLAEGKLLPGKTLESFAFEAVPMISKAQVMAMVAGRRLARQRRQYPVVWAARRRKKPSRLRHRPRLDRKWLSGAVHSHHRPRAKAANRPARPRPRRHWSMVDRGAAPLRSSPINQRIDRIDGSA